MAKTTPCGAGHLCLLTLTKMARPKQLPIRADLTEEQIKEASYVGSPEHKVERWWGGLPEAYMGADGLARRAGKQLTTICPKVTAAERDTASSWVRDALSRKQYRFYEGDKTYPKHLWYEDDAGQLWFGFAVNQILGTYKGWPISLEEKRETFDQMA
jgi:hypothetical protein